MPNKTSSVKFTQVTTDNVSEIGIYCIKDRKSPGYAAKVDWFKAKINAGLRIYIASDAQDKQLGFIEYIPSELAWRPVKASNYLFIQCIGLFVKEAKNRRIGSALLDLCEQEARQNDKSGICVMSSEGAWMANKTLFEKNGFVPADKLGRFELMHKKLREDATMPAFYDWTAQQNKYKGWHLIYADQCMWHRKSVTDLQQAATEMGIKLKVKKLVKPEEAQQAPSGFGTFSLIKDGKLLGDHYLSRTRFENIVRRESKIV